MRSLLLVLVGLGSPATADILTVPGDYSRLEDAVSAAASGDVILVQTAVEQGAYGILIDKPLTIVGDPICNIDLRFGGMHLTGPGSGAVTLVNVAIDYLAPDENGYPSLWGGGFDELILVGCRVMHENLAPSGLITSSYPAIDLFGEVLLTVVESDLMGGNSGSDVCAPPLIYPRGREAIYAPDATVILLDSTAVGGNGGGDGLGGVTLDMCCASCSCPRDLSIWGGFGGDGVVARELHSLRSYVMGGEGIAWYAFPGGTNADPQGTPTKCGEQPDGLPYRVSEDLVVRRTGPLSVNSSRPRMGGEWTLVWDVEALPTCLPGKKGCYHDARAFLLASFGPPRAPVSFGEEWIYLDLTSFSLVAAFPVMQDGELSMPVPNTLEALGLVVTAQVAITTGQMTSPVVGLVVP